MTPSRANRSSSTALTTLDGSSTGIKRYDLGDLDEDGDDVDINGLGLSGPDGGLGKGLEDFEAYHFEDDNDVKQLIRAWMRERGTRDIMLWEGELLETILHKVEQQVSFGQTVLSIEGDRLEILTAPLLASGLDAGVVTVRSQDVGRGTLQAPARLDRSRASQVSHQELPPLSSGQGESF